MTSDTKSQLDELKRQVDADALLSPEPVLTDVAAKSREAAGMVRDVVGEYADQLAGLVRDRPLTTVVATFVGAYFLGRIGRYL